MEFAPKTWIALGAIVAGIGLYKILNPVDDVTGSYLMIWCLVLYAGWTMVAVPYLAWGAELSSTTTSGHASRPGEKASDCSVSSVLARSGPQPYRLVGRKAIHRDHRMVGDRSRDRRHSNFASIRSRIRR